jgi:protein gp37
MTDLFGEWMYPFSGKFMAENPSDLIAACKSSDATYLWLTKRVENMAFELADGAFSKLEEDRFADNHLRLSHLNLSNHYFGFTAENQERYDERYNDVMNGRWPQWANLWLSAEPLLGPIELTPVDLAIGGIGVPRIFKWVVVGCESGPNRRPCKIEWVESIVEQCRSAGVPVFVKQLDIGGRCVTDINKFPEHLRIRQVPWEAKEES